jgi:trans-aconitate methyltransferase
MAALALVSNPAFLDRVDFSRFNRILDVGGGDGKNLVQFAARWPGLGGTLFDFPAVALAAQKRFTEHGLSDRFKVHGGNVLEDAFPEGHDCMLFNRFTHTFALATNLRLLKRAYAALEPGGMVCLRSAFMNDKKTGPLRAVMPSPYFLCTVNGEGRVYSWAEMSACLEEAGFSLITRVPLLLGDGALLGFKR